MQKGQVSVEYMMLLTATATLLVLIAIVLYSFITPSHTELIPVSNDIVNCQAGGGGVVRTTIAEGTPNEREIEQYVTVNVGLKGYFQPYEGTDPTSPARITWNDKEFTPESGTYTCPKDTLPTPTDSILVCELQKQYQLNFSQANGDTFHLQETGGQCFNYTAPGGGGPGTMTVLVAPTDVYFFSSGGSGNSCPNSDRSAQINQDDEIHLKYDIPFPQVPRASINEIKLVYKMDDDLASCPDICQADSGRVGEIALADYGNDPTTFSGSTEDLDFAAPYEDPALSWREQIFSDPGLGGEIKGGTDGDTVILAIERWDSMAMALVCVPWGGSSADGPSLEITYTP